MTAYDLYIERCTSFARTESTIKVQARARPPAIEWVQTGNLPIARHTLNISLLTQCGAFASEKRKREALVLEGGRERSSRVGASHKHPRPQECRHARNTSQGDHAQRSSGLILGYVTIIQFVARDRDRRAQGQVLNHVLITMDVHRHDHWARRKQKSQQMCSKTRDKPSRDQTRIKRRSKHKPALFLTASQ